jgi:hypothetical protein
VVDVVEVLQHWHAGRPKAVVAESLGLDVKTVRKYVAPAEAAGMAPGGPPLGRAGGRRWHAPGSPGSSTPGPAASPTRASRPTAS